MALSPEEMAEIVARLDLVCREAQELQERLRRAMIERARDQQQVVAKGGGKRRHASRKRSADRTSRRS